ncbi:glycosyltransferase family 2 protein [Vibrio sp.]|uniref:glycosyltransferase family 2 protein n=1 Tax=Vibrio sp. TaxID=678 RepID=UPI003D09A2B4
MTEFNPCFLIPCYNHGATVAGVLDSLSDHPYPVLLVDDGSNDDTRNTLRSLQNPPQVHLLVLAENQGKGGAVMAGMRRAAELGFSHVIQIDADGQHDVEALPALIEAAQQQPQRLISGRPVYDSSVPKARLYGRYATHVWVWIETLSLAIKDSMCGFRVYPLAPTLRVINHAQLGRRMDFDIEILVRMYWQGIDIDFVDTRVIYPENGISHFDALWDNLKISWMHTRLFFGMLPRIPALLARHRGHQSAEHWSQRKERGTIIGIKLLLAVYTLLGRRVFNLLLTPVMGYYHLTATQARQASEHYLDQLKRFTSEQQLPVPDNLTSYRHMLSFGHTMLDKLAAWKGDFSAANLTIHGQQLFNQMAESKQGVVILGSHLGNIELCRALSRRHSSIKINALVFTEHAEQFNAVMKAVNPNSEMNLIQVSHIGPDTAIMLQQKIEQGEWVVIVGDRTSTSKESRVVWADFLGRPAPFPQGPFMLASILKAPVYLLFGLRDDQSRAAHFEVYFEHFSDEITLPRQTRQQALQQVVQRYAQRLQHYTLQAPLQWYNFFNFWTLTEQQDEHDGQ